MLWIHEFNLKNLFERGSTEEKGGSFIIVAKCKFWPLVYRKLPAFHRLTRICNFLDLLQEV